MKRLTILLLLSSLFLLSCGKDEEEEKSTPSYKYSYCGTVQSSGQQMQLLTNSGTYNLTFENNNQTLMSQLYQYAGSGQQTCVYTNHQAQSSGGGNTGYVGYTLQNIIVQSVGGGTSTTVTQQGNYAVSFCGTIYASYIFGGPSTDPRYNIQVSSNGSIEHYQLQASNTNVSSMLSQVNNQDKSGCAYANQQPVQSGYSLILQTEQVVFQ